MQIGKMFFLLSNNDEVCKVFKEECKSRVNLFITSGGKQISSFFDGVRVRPGDFVFISEDVKNILEIVRMFKHRFTLTDKVVIVISDNLRKELFEVGATAVCPNNTFRYRELLVQLLDLPQPIVV